jgi:hypothetical protein
MDFEAITKLVDTWYKALMVLGAGIFAVALFLPVHGISNGQALLLSAGVFLFGLGEWKNHKLQSWIKPANAYTGGPALIQGMIRSPDFLGVVFDIVGGCLFVWGAWQIFHTK